MGSVYGILSTISFIAFSIAYRMLGSFQDAEDIIQELFADLQEKDIGQIDHIQAYLTKSITNRCINELQSARKKREVYIGEWLPEPQVALSAQIPAEYVEEKEKVSYAFLVVMSRLNPVERAVLMFREVFGYHYKEISSIIGKSEANCRQIHSRLKQKLNEDISVFSQPVEEQQLAQLFIESAKTGNFEEFSKKLIEDAVLYTDGGGKVRSALRPIYGKSRIYAFLRSCFKGKLFRPLYASRYQRPKGRFDHENNRPAYAVCFAWNPEGDSVKMCLSCQIPIN